MSTEGKPEEKKEPPKSRIEILEEVVTELVGKMEELAGALGTLQKTAMKKSTQRFGADHSRKAIRDTKTGKVYPSMFSAGKALATDYGLDPADTKVYYQIIKKDPTRLAPASEEEATGAWTEADAQLQRVVDEANRKMQAEEAAKAAAAGGAKTTPKKGK